MESASSIQLKSSFLSDLPTLNAIHSNPSFPLLKPFRQLAVKLKASSATKPPNNPVIQKLKIAARAVIFSATAAVVISKIQQYPAIAKPITQNVVTTESETSEEETLIQKFLEPNSDAINTLLEEKLSAGEVKECLKILKKLNSIQPENFSWIFTMGILLNLTGDTESARVAFEESLAYNPLSIEALFRNALLMSFCDQNDAAAKRLEEVLEIEEEKDKESRDVRFITAQLLLMNGCPDEALRRYDELLDEDPNDSRPYFCKGMIYSFLETNDKAEVQFAKYRELSPMKY